MRHPHIVRGYETLEQPHPAVVMETLTGATLGYLIETSPEPLAVESLAHLGLQLGSAVRYLHARDVLHLDLKPANIVAEGSRAKVIDLSVARAPGDIAAGVGTWCYLAPEQAVEGFVGPPADVWGIGAVLFEAATCQPAFDDPDHSDEDEESDELSWTDDDASSGSWIDTDGGPYPQLTERAPRIDEMREVPKALARPGGRLPRAGAR